MLLLSRYASRLHSNTLWTSFSIIFLFNTLYCIIIDIHISKASKWFMIQTAFCTQFTVVHPFCCGIDSLCIFRRRSFCIIKKISTFRSYMFHTNFALNNFGIVGNISRWTLSGLIFRKSMLKCEHQIWYIRFQAFGECLFAYLSITIALHCTKGLTLTLSIKLSI